MDAIFNRTSIRKYKQESLKKEEIDLILALSQQMVDFDEK